MRVVILVDASLIDAMADRQVHVESEIGDTIDDIKVKLSLTGSDIDPDKVNLVYNGRVLKNSDDFNAIGYMPESIIYARMKARSCCLVF